MSYYWTYYLFVLFLAFAARNPWLCGAIVVIYFLRSWLPDPVAIARNVSRIGALKRQVGLNAANVTARRDLGRAYLDLNWPRAALVYLEEARLRDPADQEIAFLRGQALLLIRKNEEALSAFGDAVGADDAAPAGEDEGTKGARRRRSESHFKRFGEAYLGAATALERLGRLPQAEEALTLSASFNSSVIEPLVRLARVRKAAGDVKGAREAQEAAKRTFATLPGFMRRRQLSWGLRAYLG